MTNEMERTHAQCIARAMRAAATRAAMKSAPGESDPILAYGCVDWFRYDVLPQPKETDSAKEPATTRHDTVGGDAARRH
ncbi:MAG TPA: hypothetical protein VFX20_13355 [Steroidobacteraceae bacterium]|nr:hypothetical protein [Steroidobacteraceae bacterium]